MKKLLLASAATALMAGSATADEIKIGVMLGFTGPAESLSEDMASGAEAALKEISDSGKFLNGTTRLRAQRHGADFRFLHLAGADHDRG